MVTDRNEKALDQIIEEMIKTVKNSKNEIFTIAESARNEYDSMRVELEATKELVMQYIEEGEIIEKKVRLARFRLVEVSRDFEDFSEKDIREVYENTHAVQTQLVQIREKERHLREKRDEIERRLIRLDDTLEKAEGLNSKISVIQNYLENDFSKVNHLLEDAREKQAFGLQIIDAQEKERRKLSREIHDGPAQMLANILIRSELIVRTLQDVSVEAALKELHSVREMIRNSLYETRRIIYDLRPMALDDLGLVPTIKKYIDNLADYRNVEINFTFHGEEKRLDEKYEVVVFRLMQESLQNAIKHAKSNFIQVKLQLHNDKITLIVKDDGLGFDLNEKKSNSFGLIGMRERVETLEGTLKIETIVNKGTSVIIQIPYRPTDDPK